MPFTTHRLEEIREGTARARCTRCGQTWTSWHVRSACPGVPVYPYEETPPYLKTLFALERERKYPPDPELWDGAYRILKAPYYRVLYEERKAIHKPLSEKQLAAIERRKAAIEQKYTCWICQTFSTGRHDRRSFFDGVCNQCRYLTRRYNEQIAWAQALLENQTVVLDLQTDPEVHPYSIQEDEQPLLTGYTAMDLETGAILRHAEMKWTEDLYYLKHLVCPDFSALEPYPWVLDLYPGALYAVRFELQRNAKGVYLFNPNLQGLLGTWNLELAIRDGRPTSVFGWQDLPHNKHMTARQVLEMVCTLHEVAAQGPTVELMRSLVLHLAALQPIELASRSQENTR